MDETGPSGSELDIPEATTKNEKDFSKINLDRADELKKLDELYPKGGLVTASEILSLHAINETLSEMTNLDDEKSEGFASSKNSLEFEQEQIINKIGRIIAYTALDDALEYPNEQNIDSASPEVSQLASRLVEDHQKRNTHGDRILELARRGSDPLDIISELQHEVFNGRSPATRSDITTALEAATEMSNYETWKLLSKKALEVLNNPHPTAIQIQGLLSSIHQGGFHEAKDAQEVSRPVLEYITDKPWEVANVLTSVNAGIPRATPTPMPSSVTKLITPYRVSPHVSNYLSPVQMDEQTVNSLYKSTENKPFFKAALSFNQSIPTELITKVKPTIDFKKDSESMQFRDKVWFGQSDTANQKAA